MNALNIFGYLAIIFSLTIIFSFFYDLNTSMESGTVDNLIEKISSIENNLCLNSKKILTQSFVLGNDFDIFYQLEPNELCFNQSDESYCLRTRCEFSEDLVLINTKNNPYSFYTCSISKNEKMLNIDCFLGDSDLLLNSI